MIDRKALHRKIEELASVPRGEAHVIVLLENYIHQNLDDVVSLLAYADALRIVGRHSEAKRLLQSALELAKKTPVRAELAMSLAMATESTAPEEAEHWFSQYLAFKSDAPGWAWILRGANLSRLERFDAAIDCFKQALKQTDVDRDEALLNIALAYRAKCDYEQALIYLNRSRMVSASEATAQLRAGLQGLQATRKFLEGPSDDD